MPASHVRGEEDGDQPTAQDTAMSGGNTWAGNRVEHTGRCKCEGDALVRNLGDGFMGVHF